MQPRKALGRGLDALIPTAEQSPAEEKMIFNGVPANLGERIRSVPVDAIVPNRLQPRKSFDEEKLKDLASSIKEQGVIQPLIVTQVGPARYELIAGERRLRASKLAGLTDVPVIIKSADTEKMLELAIIENIQREDLNAIEEALAIKELIDQFDYTQEEAAKSLGKTRVAVANSLRLLNLPKLIQEDVASGRLSAGHARSLLAVTNLQEQLQLREKILHSGLTVRDIEKMVQDLRSPTQKTRKVAAPLTPQMKLIIDEMTRALATKVRVEQDREKKGGRVVIDYYSPQDLDRVYRAIVE